MKKKSKGKNVVKNKQNINKNKNILMTVCNVTLSSVWVALLLEMRIS